MNISMKSDCRKFSPNIFNKSKCQNCFRTKDAHTAEALESNRASRKISKCGYLFVAPDWDFSVSINRTKRWQRRWFVLYDDGELTYSVDEHPNTIPQALIDMNQVLEVSDAEQLTGNQFALAITDPERIHFVKGTSRDETKWWYDVLSHYPHGTVRSRHKRNATFSGLGSNTIVTTAKADLTSGQQKETLVLRTVSQHPSERYVRSHSFNQAISNSNEINNKTLSLSGGVELDFKAIEVPTKQPQQSEIIPIREKENANVEDNNNGTTIANEELENLNNLIKNSLGGNKRTITPKENLSQITAADLDTKNGNVILNTEELETDDNQRKVPNRRYIKRENRTLRSQRSRSDGVAKMIPMTPPPSAISPTSANKQFRLNSSEWSSVNFHQNPVFLLLKDVRSSLQTTPVVNPSKRKEEETAPDPVSGSPLLNRLGSGRRQSRKPSGVSEQEAEQENRSRTTRLAQEVEILAQTISDSLSSKTNSSLTSGDPEESARPRSLTGSPFPSPLLTRRHSLSSTRGSKSSASSSPLSCTMYDSGSWKGKGKGLSRSGSLRKSSETLTHQLRGDPDGCQVNHSSLTPEMHLEIGKEGILEKKGWLVRLGVQKEWFRHWFVLRGSSLSYFRDPMAEKSGILDGILDLVLLKEVKETNQAFTERNNAPHYYAFRLTTWDNKKYILGAMVPTLRTAWVESIRVAASLQVTSSNQEDSNQTLQLQAGEDRLLSRTTLPLLLSSSYGVSNREPVKTLLSPLTAGDCPPLSSNSSTTSDDHSEYFSVVDEEDLAERSSSPKALPPSPPVNRTAISRVKEKSKSRSRSNSRSRLGRRKARSLSNVSDASNSGTWGDSSSQGIGGDEVDHISDPDKSDMILDHSLDFQVVPSLEFDSSEKVESTPKPLERISSNEETRKQANVLATQNLLRLLIDCRSCLMRLKEMASFSSEQEGKEEGDWKKHLGDACSLVERALSEGSQPCSESMEFSSKLVLELSVLVDKAREEIRRLKSELKQSQDHFDDLEIESIKFRHDALKSEEIQCSNLSLMTARVDDLTSKLSSSERSLRLAKQRVAKLEARQERKRSSLKGKEAVSLSKEFEGKLFELEQKIGSIELSFGQPSSSEPGKTSPVTQGSTGDASSTDMLLRLHSLDCKVKDASRTFSPPLLESNPPSDEMSSDNQELPDRPKICLQIKDSEKTVGIINSSLEDSGEQWKTLSVTTSMSDLRVLENESTEESPPNNLQECLDTLSLKLELLRNWLRDSLKDVLEDGESIKELELILFHQEEDSLNGVLDSSKALYKATRFLSKLNGMDKTSRWKSNLFCILDVSDCCQRLETKILEGICTWNCFAQEIKALAKAQVKDGDDGGDICQAAQEMVEKLESLKALKLKELAEAEMEESCTEHKATVKEILDQLESQLDQMGMKREELISSALSNLETCFSNFSAAHPDSQILFKRIGRLVLMQTILRTIAKEVSSISPDLRSLVSCYESLVLNWKDDLVGRNVNAFNFQIQSMEEETQQLKLKIIHLETQEAEPCPTCCDLQKQVCRLQTDLRACQRRMGQGGVPCERCRELHRRLEILSERHQMELASALEREREEHRSELQCRLAEIVAQQEEDRKSDRAEVMSLKREAKAFENEAKQLRQQFEERLDYLKSVYRERINFGESWTTSQLLNEQVLETYKMEMDDIKAFCQKGLSMMEESHRQSLSELQERHEKEIQVLRSEKDQALALESQATAKALEMLQSAHQREMEVEVNKLREQLKQETLVQQTQQAKDSELDFIKGEILKLSQKYSAKCLEASLTQEKLNAIIGQLKNTDQEVMRWFQFSSEGISNLEEMENAVGKDQDEKVSAPKMN